jgi:hypothetical protein
MYASFLWISEALHLDIFHQPLRNRVFDSLLRNLQTITHGFPFKGFPEYGEKVLRLF